MELKGPDELQVNIGIATGVMSPEDRQKISNIEEIPLNSNPTAPSTRKQALKPMHVLEAIRRLCPPVNSLIGFTCERTIHKLL